MAESLAAEADQLAVVLDHPHATRHPRSPQLGIAVGEGADWVVADATNVVVAKTSPPMKALALVVSALSTSEASDVRP